MARGPILINGTSKNDGERNAVQHFIAKLRRDHPHLNVIVTEDSRSANAPHCEMLQAHDVHYLVRVHRM